MRVELSQNTCSTNDFDQLLIVKNRTEKVNIINIKCGYVTIFHTLLNKINKSIKYLNKSELQNSQRLLIQ